LREENPRRRAGHLAELAIENSRLFAPHRRLDAFDERLDRLAGDNRFRLGYHLFCSSP
jgi:hypothetical protein